MQDISLKKKILAIFLDKEEIMIADDIDSFQLYFCEIPQKDDIIILELDSKEAMADEDIEHLIPFLEKYYPGNKHPAYSFKVQEKTIVRSMGESWVYIDLSYLG